MNSFESSLSAALGQVQAGVLYLAAVSGGADSTAMLAGLAALASVHRRKEAPFGLHCIHIEHGIRPLQESRGDAQAVLALCERLEVPCRLIYIPPGRIAAFARKNGSGIEAAARFFRHRAWNREAIRIKADRILVGHTQDDLLETLLMRILKGSGPVGLAPMRRKGRILRPLLDLNRQDILKYLEEKGIPYRTDASNTDLQFLRNRIRHKLIPLLEEFFPSWRSSLLALAETQSLCADFLSSEARERLPWEKESGELGKILSLKLKEEVFFKAPSILQEEAFFAALNILSGLSSNGRRGPAKTPRRASLRRALEQGQLTPSQFNATDLGPVRLERQNGFITMKPSKKHQGEKGFSFLIDKAGIYTLKAGIYTLKAGGKDICINAASHAAFPIVLRNHEKGERLLKGGHKRRLSAILDSSVRSRYTGFITVCDKEGPAAFIAVSHCGGLSEDLIVIYRDGIKTGDFSFTFGGVDV